MLCSAYPSNSFANRISFSSQRNQLRYFDSSFTCGDAVYEVLLFLYASPYRCRNNVSWSLVIDHPNFIFSYAPKKFSAHVVSETVYNYTWHTVNLYLSATRPQRSIFQPSLLLLWRSIKCGVQLEQWFLIFFPQRLFLEISLVCRPDVLFSTKNQWRAKKYIKKSHPHHVRRCPIFH